MTTQLFDTGKDSGAIFSPCRTWRYQLWRRWDPDKPTVLFIALNPSTADAEKLDPTCTRCMDFAKRWGFGTYLMCNLFGFRSTDPRGLATAADPVGPENDWHIQTAVESATTVVAAWGRHQGIGERAGEVLSMIPVAHCLRVTKNGFPWHPLYVPGNTRLVEYWRR
jgi:hypothetical protein